MAEAMTTIPVKVSTLHVLQYYKLGGKTWDEVMIRFMEDHPPDAFLREMARRAKYERSHPIKELYHRAGLE